MNSSVLKIRKNTAICERQIESQCSSGIKYLMCTMLASSRGGINRIKIISKLRETPLNLYKLSQELDLHYKAIQHHILILEKNNLIISSDNRYRKMYFISPLLESNMKVFDEISLKMRHYL